MGQVVHRMLFTSDALPEAAPVVGGMLPEDLRLFLLAALPRDEKALRRMGFDSCVDHPECPDHHYMEGYFHASHGGYGFEVDSIHPRRGCSFKRQAAPAPLHAFCEAFRRANAPLFTALEDALAKSRTSAPLAEVLRRRAHCADLSVQVHWGEEVPAQHIAWHVDAPNSLLHLALGLQGRRALHARRDLRRGRISQNCLIGPADDRDTLWQEEGAAYLSAPCCFPHAVEYPASGVAGPVVAVQCRLLLHEDELFGMVGGLGLDTDPNGGTAGVVFRQLMAHAGAGLSLPGLEDVRGVVAEYRATAALGPAAG